MKKNKKITRFTKIYCIKVSERKENGQWVLHDEAYSCANFCREVTHKEYYYITCDETVNFFRNLGGTEEITRDQHHRVLRLVSTSPCKDLRTIYSFEFVDSKVA